jgi:hypothetical protein
MTALEAVDGGPRVLAVVPVYNHGATLREVVEGVLAEGLPVLVVDDGSTDGALERIQGLACRSLRLEPNQGKGAAILEAARLALKWGYDALLTHLPSDAPGLVDVARRHWPAIVLGCRRMDHPDVPRSSRFGRAFSNFWVRLESGLNLGDTQSGYRIYPAALLAGTPCRSRRYAFEVEILVRAAWGGAALVDHPVQVHYPPGGERISHFKAFQDNLRLTALHTVLFLRSLGPRPGWKAGLDPAALAAQGKEALRHPVAFLRGLAGASTSPLELAMAAGMGVFLGSLPIIPFGLATILYVNRRLNLNLLAGAAASNLCVAPFVPFLCVQVGHVLRTGHLWREFTRRTLLLELHLRVWEWLLGACVAGPLLGVAAGALTYALVRRARR